MLSRLMLAASATLLLLSSAWLHAYEVVAGPAQTLDSGLRWTTYRRFASREGLPRNWVSALAQDRDGFVYAGTEEGLARYDGRQWSALLLPLGRAARQPYINALAATPDGAVWVGTDTAGLFIYRNGRFARRALPGAEAASVETVYGDAAGGAWVGTNNGLFHCDDICTEVVTARGLDIKRVLPGRDAAGEHLYLGTAAAGVYRIDDPHGAMRRADWRLTQQDGLPDDAVGALMQWGGAQGNDLWIGTAGGVARLAGDRLVVYSRASGFPGGASGLLRMPQREGAQKLIATLPDGGIAEFDETGNWRLATTANGLPENAINAAMLAYADQPGAVLWLASGHNGVLRAEPRMWSALNERNGLPNRVVYALGEARFLDERESVWIGTADGSVRWNGSGWQTWLPEPYAHREVLDVVRDGEQLAVATRQGFLQVTRSGVREFTSADSALPDNTVLGLHLQTSGDDAGVLWLGTRRGLAKMRGDRLEAEKLPTGLTDFFVRLIRSTRAADGDTLLWAGAEQGLFYKRQGEWHAVTCAGLAGVTVFDLRERGAPGNSHALWVGTFDGAVRVDLDRDFACTALALPASTRASSIYQIQFDRQDRMYLFGAYGVLRMTPDRGTPDGYRSEHFDLADGLPDLEFTRASLVDAQGRVWGGGLEGATLYDPAAETPSYPPRPLRLLGVKDEKSGRSLDEGADLDAAQSDVAFDVSLLSYDRDHRMRYRTQLLGLDAQPGDWIDSGRRSYSRLPPDEYEFRAWARDANEVESGPINWRFRVHAPWWQRPWAYAAYALAFVLFGLSIGRLRARAHERRAQALEVVVAERTRALAEVNRQLEQASLTDPLTGLWNRRYFGMQMPPECERAIRRVSDGESAADLVFVLLDVDHFKRINDEHGHAAGDTVLVEFARRIRALLRSGDIGVRWGGEEFLVMLRDVERAKAEILVARLQQAAAASPFRTEVGDLHVSCSAGWAAFPFRPDAPRQHDVDTLIAFADAALYQAKRSGRNRAVGAVANRDASTNAAEFTLVDAPG